MKIIDYKQIGTNIKECRKRMKISQEGLADMVSISRNYIQKIEGGRAKISLEVLLRISDALHVPVSILIREVKNDFPLFYDDIFQVLDNCSMEEYEIIALAIKDLSVNLRRFKIEIE